SARTVLLKAIEGGELVFGTSLDSRKGRELLANPRVACVLHWPKDGRQVRVEGVARVASREETEALWAARGRDGRLVDHVSDEGAPMGSPDELTEAFAAADAELGQEIPCPEDWAAVRIGPEMVELWEAGERRQAVRRAYLREGDGWREERLWP
ncbi:MAG TPA: pyridoxamine 5'-phosphate oxidase family protein, partial [Solirubrobacteraceae bacterium]